MAGMNPRISVTLKPSLDAAIRRLCDATGQSKSSLVAEFLEQAEPVLVRMAELIEVAQTATEDAKARMRSNLDEAQTKLEEHLGLVNQLWDEQTADLLGEVEQVQRRKKKGASTTLTDGREDGGRGRAGATRPPVEKASRPPRLTGGSHPTPEGKKQARQSAAKPSPSRKRS